MPTSPPQADAAPPPLAARRATSPLAEYRAQLAAGQLGYQVDTATGRAVFYPRLAAPGTGNALDWKASAGLGTVYATTVVHARNEAPYNVALIDMDEGFRLMSRVESVPAAEVCIGLRVQVRIHQPGGEEPPYPVFTPLEAA